MKTIFSSDTSNKKMLVTREFAAPLELTWKAWTDKKMLDVWWAPKPWRTETKEMDFRKGGHWLYSMNGPAGEKHWARCDFQDIVPQKYYLGKDSFCDENGNKLVQPPGMDWKVEFQKTDSGTKVSIEITFASEKDMKAIIEMGFEQGFTMAHSNLDELLAKEVQTA